MKPLHRIFTAFFIVPALSVLSMNFASAQNMSASEVYQRCHLRLARSLPPATDKLAADVRAGKMDASAACMALLRMADFAASGEMINKEDARARMVLKTMHDFHRTYFQSRKNENLAGPSYLIRDGEEGPLYLTRALFMPKEKFSSVVTLNHGLQGIRYRPADRQPGSLSEFTSNPVARYGTTFPRFGDRNLSVSYPFRAYVEGTIGFSMPLPAGTGAPRIIEPPEGHVFVGNGTFSANIENSVEVPDITDFGQLVGVKPSTSLILRNYFPVVGTGALRKEIVNRAANFEANAHFGGGIVGSQNFIANNANLLSGQLPQDVTLINRRLTNRIYEDLLCHQMPSLTAEDVAREVNPKSPHPFENGASCMQCHSSIDPLAHTYRNIVSFRTNVGENLQGFAVTGMHQVPVVPSANVYAATAPAGRIMYRQLLGGGVQKKNVNSIAEIGQALANERDLYLCAAKKYYQFFTGINVNLTRVAEEGIERSHQQAIERLAEGLQRSQSVEDMINDIFRSDAFRTRNVMTVESQQ